MNEGQKEYLDYLNHLVAIGGVQLDELDDAMADLWSLMPPYQRQAIIEAMLA